MKHYCEFEIEESLLTQLDALAQGQKCSRDEIIREAVKSYLSPTESQSQPPEISKGDPT